MQLALGTVQFGQAYGIAGRGQAVPEDEIRAILVAAAEEGVGTLDTAAAYGDIEPRLARLCGDLPFSIISKIPSLPAGLSPANQPEWVLDHAEQSQDRLGDHLAGLMFHNVDDLRGEAGGEIWREIEDWGRHNGIAIGVSTYGASALREVQDAYPVTVAQIPGNVFDQAVQSVFPTPQDDCVLFLRSAFLQGLLLMPPDEAQRALPVAKEALQAWQAWLAKNQVSPLVGCLSIVKGFAAVSQVVVGVDRLSQFKEIAAAWRKAQPLSAPELAQGNPSLIDPRQWPKAAP